LLFEVSNLADRLAAPSPDFGFAVVDDHNKLLAAIRRRIAELDVSYETVEYLSGIQSGYLSKITAEPPPKRVCPFTWFVVLRALGLRVRLEEDSDLVEKLRPRWTKRKLTKKAKLAAPSIIELTPDFMRSIARRGGYARAQKLDGARRSAIASAGGKARWSKRETPTANPQAGASPSSVEEIVL
jgi:hypothetical protein